MLALRLPIGVVCILIVVGFLFQQLGGETAYAVQHKEHPIILTS